MVLTLVWIGVALMATALIATRVNAIRFGARVGREVQAFSRRESRGLSSTTVVRKRSFASVISTWQVCSSSAMMTCHRVFERCGTVTLARAYARWEVERIEYGGRNHARRTTDVSEHSHV